MADRIEIFLAGRVAVATTDREPVECALGCRARVAFGYLVVERWRPVAADELANAVWGEELPPTWRAALRGVIARIRAALTAAGIDGARVLTSGVPGYQIDLPAGSTVDIEGAERSLQAALERVDLDPFRACADARAAAHVLRGDFLAGAEGPWVERRQAELTEFHVRALEVLSTAAMSSGDPAGALRAAEEAVSLQPFRESAHVRVMAAHEAAGNRAAALRAYERCRRRLAEELGIAPGPGTERVYIELLGQEPPAFEAPAVAATGNLPAPLTRFVGRQGERARIADLLTSTRLVTMTGPGGVGKSRLAIEVAGDLARAYPDGVWLIELAALADSSLLVEQATSVLGVADAAGATAMQSLLAHLRSKRSLLVLDNCEHLVAACAPLVDCVLRACAGVRVLATSREPLCIGGETIFALPPLSIPPAGEEASLGSLLRHDAVALFVDRAHAASPELDLEPSAAAVATVCRRVDGIPLAIELAAARVRSLTVPEIAQRLSDRFDLLAAGPRTAPRRHQTLRAALDWSYDGLSSPERRIFVALSVFSGSFTAEAADAICGEPAVELVFRLVDKSLVVADRSGSTTRYRLLETIRHYGKEKLGAERAGVAASRALLQWSATLAEAAEAGLEGPDQPVWLRTLDAEHDNIRGALDWAAAETANLDGPRTAAALWRYWEIRGFLGEGRSRIEAMMRVDAPASLLAKLSNSAAVLAQSQGHLPAARRLYQRALDLRRSLGDRLGVTAALNGLGNVAVGEDDLFGAKLIFEQNLDTSRELGDPRMIAASLMNLGVVVQLLFVTGRTSEHEGAAEAHALYSESQCMYRALGDTRGVAQSLENLGAIAPYQGDDGAAQSFLEESLVLRRQLHDKSGIAASARFLGHLALKGRRYGAARGLHEECLAIESELGNRLLMVADLASLAEIAEGEGDHDEAGRRIEDALALSDALGDTGSTTMLRVRLQALAESAR